MENNSQGIYALSLRIRLEEDDPVRPRLYFGHSPTEFGGGTQELNQHEKKNWNPANWARLTGTIIGSSYDENQKQQQVVKLRAEWLETLDIWTVKDNGKIKLKDGAGSVVMDAAFYVCVALVQRLHAQKIIRDVVGQVVPVIVHDLDCGIESYTYTNEANPPGLLEEFEEWILEWNWVAPNLQPRERWLGKQQ